MPDRELIDQTLDSVAYREDESLVWDFLPEAREWALQQRIAQLERNVTEASFEVTEYPTFSA